MIPPLSHYDGAIRHAHTGLKTRLRRFWDAEDVYWTTLEGHAPPLIDIASTYIADGSRILDVACGNGNNSKWLFPRCKYFGSDLSQTGLQRVRLQGLRLACADAEALPFADEHFDAAIATFALEHSVEPASMLREMYRVVKLGGRIVLLGPTWDYPFWYPNSLGSRAGSLLWRLRYTLGRLAAQIKAVVFGKSPFLIVEEPDAFSQPFVCDADAVYVVWSYEVIRQMKRWGCRLLHCEVDNRLLGSTALVRLMKRLLMLLPQYRFAGSTVLMVFER